MFEVLYTSFCLCFFFLRCFRYYIVSKLAIVNLCVYVCVWEWAVTTPIACNKNFHLNENKLRSKRSTKRRVINQNSSNVSQHQKFNLVLIDFFLSLFRMLSLSLSLFLSLSLSLVYNFVYESKSKILHLNEYYTKYYTLFCPFNHFSFLWIDRNSND